MIAKISLLPWLILFSCMAYGSPNQALPLKILLQEAWQREYQLIATKPDQYELTKQQKHRVWLAGYLALHHLGPSTEKARTELLQRAAEFQLNAAQIQTWQAASPAEVFVTFLNIDAASTQKQDTTLIKFLKLDQKENCTLSEGLAKQADAPMEKIIQASFWRNTNLPLKASELICFTATLVRRFQESPIEAHDPQVWLATLLSRDDQPNLRLLASWRALHSQDYRASLEYLYPIVYQDPIYRYAYEAVQRVYQLAEKGKGAVALKRL